VTTPAAVVRTAADDLARFLAAARTADRALDREDLAAVDPRRLAATIPAGMDRDLLTATLLVYGDLVSRRAGLRVTVEPVFANDADNIRRGLANAAAAAARYPADRAALLRLARSKQPVTARHRLSRAAAEVAVRAEWIRLENMGCLGTGGVIPTTLADVRWEGASTRGERFAGRVRGVPFVATYAARTGWKAAVEAC
jgi:hypothetical protein